MIPGHRGCHGPGGRRQEELGDDGLLTKKGETKIVATCSYPLTGLACVKRVYTDLATLECTPQGCDSSTRWSDEHRASQDPPRP